MAITLNLKVIQILYERKLVIHDINIEVLNFRHKKKEKKMKYRVHRFDFNLAKEGRLLEDFLNSLRGDIVSIIPNVTWFPKTQIDFVLVIEKIR